VRSVAFEGIKVLPVDVQVQMTSGIANFIIVGLPDKAVAESRERVRAALTSLGIALPPKRIIVNLSPADLQKEGSHYDLPIALALLVALGAIAHEDISAYIALGELGLDGRISPVSGVLPAALEAASEDLGIICPATCGGEAAWAGGIQILAAPNLISLLNHFKGRQVLAIPKPKLAEEITQHFDLIDLKGQETAKRALEVAAAGGHNLLMQGPPGAGKSMLAARLPGLLPPLTAEEALEVTMIHSIAGMLGEGKLLTKRPFRDPHHSASLPAMVGGGLKAKPGEISLAHRGILFLDELPEFARGTLETLRQPLETGKVMVARVNAHVTYPASFQLIAAMNPCRCGYLDDPERACSRAPRCSIDYQSKISGPLLDRIDLNVFIPAVKPQDLRRSVEGESSKSVAERIFKVREIQRRRYAQIKSDTEISTNAMLTGKFLEEFATPDKEGSHILEMASEKFKLSARGYHRILRVARTIADLDNSTDVRLPHVSEAIAFRHLGNTAP
jgi:magnesium chelatase family protein